MAQSRRLVKSTNDRFIIRWLTRTLVRALEVFAPRLASAFVARAFLHPPRFPPPASERSLVERSAQFELTVRGEVLHGYRIGDGPAVLLVHGWGGRWSQLAAFVEPLLGAGYSVVGFDAPAHGRSTGKTASVPQFAEAIRAFAAAVDARAAIAHSMGAAALALAISRGVQLEAAVLVSPPRSPKPFFDQFSAELAVVFYTRERARAFVERWVGARMEDLDVAIIASELATPALVLHDRDDQEVPCDDGIAIARAWPDSRLVLTDGLGHRRILKNPGVLAAAAGFIEARLRAPGRLRVANEEAALPGVPAMGRKKLMGR